MKEQANPDAKRASIGCDKWQLGQYYLSLSQVKEGGWGLKIELGAMAKLDKDRYNCENKEWNANMLMKKIDGHKATARAESLVDMVEKISGHLGLERAHHSSS